MSNLGKRRPLATVVLGLALMSLPAGRASAAEAACVWQKATWELPVGTNAGTVDGYDGNRYAVGVTGRLSLSGIGDPHGTLWDKGKVVLRITGGTPHLRGVNAAGLVVGDDVVNNRFVAVTIDRSGQSTLLPANPAWESSSAWLVNNAGDIVGSAGIGLQHIVVVWPANAPGTYRELPTPNVSFLHLTAIDEQGRITAQTDSGSGGGFVWDTDGQWRVLEAQGANGFGTPWAVRDGRVVGGMNGTSSAAAEWNAQGRLVSTIRDGAISAVAIGGNGTVGGYAFVGSHRRAVLWRDGVIVDPLPAVTPGFGLRGISDDERTLVGTEANRPAQYFCS